MRAAHRRAATGPLKPLAALPRDGSSALSKGSGSKSTPARIEDLPPIVVPERAMVWMLREPPMALHELERSLDDAMAAAFGGDIEYEDDDLFDDLDENTLDDHDMQMLEGTAARVVCFFANRFRSAHVTGRKRA